MASTTPGHAKLPDELWPFAAIEVTVLGHGDQSLPIEIGFARWRGIDEPIESWSTQICPEISWLDHPCWLIDHKLARWAQRCLIDLGRPVEAICRRLNAELFGGTVCCEGLAPALISLIQLYTAVEATPSFQSFNLSSLESLAEPGMRQWLEDNDNYPTSPRTRAIWILRAFANGRKRRPERIVLR